MMGEMAKRRSFLPWLIIALIVVGIVLILRGTIFRKPGSMVDATGVACNVAGAPYDHRWLAHLTIITDDMNEPVPLNAGLDTCAHAVHTATDIGMIHIDAQDQQDYFLGDFFAVMGKPINRMGYRVTATLNGQPWAGDPGTIPLTDQAQIVLTYTSLSRPVTSSTTSGGASTSYELTSGNNGQTFIYPVGATFRVVLNGSDYPKKSLACTPAGIIGPASGIPAVAAPFYAAPFKTLATGTCTLSSGGFSVTVSVR